MSNTAKTKRKTRAATPRRSRDHRALSKEAGVIFRRLEKDLVRVTKKYDMSKMKVSEAKGEGYFFVYAKSKAKKKESTFSWGQSNFNFPLSAIAGTLDAVSQATIKLDLLTLFAQNLGRQFEEQYGKDFAEAIMLEFYDFLNKHFGDEK